MMKPKFDLTYLKTHLCKHMLREVLWMVSFARQVRICNDISPNHYVIIKMPVIWAKFSAYYGVILRIYESFCRILTYYLLFTTQERVFRFVRVNRQCGGSQRITSSRQKLQVFSLKYYCFHAHQKFSNEQHQSTHSVKSWTLSKTCFHPKLQGVKWPFVFSQNIQ